MAKVPCKDCTDREVGCHGKCDRYKKFKEDRDAEVKTIINNKKKDSCRARPQNRTSKLPRKREGLR